jgi:signal peptidase I
LQQEKSGMGAAKTSTVNLPNLELSPTEFRQFLFGPRPRRTLVRVFLWSVLTIVFFHHLLVPIQIIGSSMYPTYQSGSLNLVNRFSYSKHPPLRGDVVALSAEGELLLKRIVALPGETVSIRDGEIHINGRPLSDRFSVEKVPWEMDPTSLSANEYFVIGDNRTASVFCKVQKQNILGKIIF